MSLKVAQVIAGIDPRYGGPSYSVPRLNQALGELGVQSTLYSVADAGMESGQVPGPADADSAVQLFGQDFARIPLLGGLRLSAELSRALARACPAADIVHSHGLWLMPNVAAGHAARRNKIALVVSPRGMLSAQALQFSKRKKQLFWTLLQHSAYRHAACYHATSEQEAEDIRRFGIRAPIAVIGNGVDLPENSQIEQSRSSNTERMILALGRLHPIKGLDTLISAWARLAPLRPNWSLCICGPDEAGYARSLQQQIDSLQCPRVTLSPPQFGSGKWRLIQRAALFVSASKSENFGLSIAEALGCGKPAIVAHGAPWQVIEQAQAGWWLPGDVDSLYHALFRASALPDAELEAMGARGAALIAREFSWAAIAQKTRDLYTALLSGTADFPGPIRK